MARWGYSENNIILGSFRKFTKIKQNALVCEVLKSWFYDQTAVIYVDCKMLLEKEKFQFMFFLKRKIDKSRMKQFSW